MDSHAFSPLEPLARPSRRLGLGRISWFAVFTSGLFLLGFSTFLHHASADEPTPALFPGKLPFAIGERLVYEGHVKVAGALVHAGEATFTVTEPDPATLLFTSTARGEKLGYRLDTTISSRVQRGALSPIRFEYRQRGSERSDKKLLFRQHGAVYMKVKHCRTEGCTHQDHLVKRTNWVGVIPWGTRVEHCDEKRCKIPTHRLWRERGRHEYEGSFLDLLTGVYFARTLDLDSDETTSIPIVNDRDRWIVDVRVLDRAPVTVKAGTYDAARIILEPRAVEGSIKKEFEGLFGIHGAIEIWIDRKSRLPLRLRGKLPFAFMSLQAQVELTEVGSVAAEDAPKKQSDTAPTRPKTSGAGTSEAGTSAAGHGNSTRSRS